MATKENEQPDYKALKMLYAQGGIFTALLDDYASRTKNPTSTTLDRIEHRLRRVGHIFRRSEVVDGLKGLGDAGCGSFMLGRRGSSTRMEWTVPMALVGRKARGDAETTLDDIAADLEDEPEEELGVTDEGMLTHSYRLRADVTVEIALPESLTSKEAARLADFIKSLPFDDDA